MSTTKYFSLTAIINGVTFNKRTQDIQKTLLSLKPELVLTEMYITIKSGKQVAERKLDAKQARKLFNDDEFRSIFMNNLLIV